MKAYRQLGDKSKVPSPLETVRNSDDSGQGEEPAGATHRGILAPECRSVSAAVQTPISD